MDLSVSNRKTIFTYGILVGITSLLHYFELLYINLYVIICFLFGFCYVIFHQSNVVIQPKKRNLDEVAENYKFSPGINSLLKELKDSFERNAGHKERHSMASSPEVDAILEQILTFFMRDFVDNWYSGICSDSGFQESLKRMIRRTISAFSFCLSKVDWQELLTRDIVDDVASHFRLFRKAKEKLDLKKEISYNNLESLFFDVELEMEKNYCRDLVSTTPEYEIAYFKDVVDILLYLLMPSEDFRCRPLRFILRDILVNRIFVPCFDKLSNPDYVNYMIVWILSEVNIDTDAFILSLETSHSVPELEAILESIDEEINGLKSKDKGREFLDIVYQQIASLEFAAEIIKKRMVVLTSHPDLEILNEIEIGEQITSDLVQLPITVIMTNNVAISYFTKFLRKHGGQNYIDCFLAIEGFKVSTEQQFKALAGGEVQEKDVAKVVKDSALFLYHQFLSQEAKTRVPLDENIINKFLARLRNDEPADTWFEAIEEKLIDILSKENQYYPAFKKSNEYIDLLIELGILLASDLNKDDESIADEEDGKSISSLGSFTSLEFSQPSVEYLKKNLATSVVIEHLGIGHQGQKSFILYNVRVRKESSDETSASEWNVIRRYSDFYKLNQIVKEKYPKLKHISFPGKKAFNNFDTMFLEKRSTALNLYVNTLLETNILEANNGLDSIIYDFLTQKTYTGIKEGLSKKVISSLFNPVVTSVKAIGTVVTSVPDQVMDGVTKVSTGLNRAASQVLNTMGSKSDDLSDYSRVAADIQNETFSDNIPLRVLLLFVDEVFVLRGRGQWFRRQLTSLLHQIISATLGGSINKKIIDLVNWLTSSEQVVQYLIAFRESMWPNGILNTKQESRSLSSSLRTRLFARTQMYASIPDELRIFIGTNVAVRGVSNISDCLQNRHLNRRLIYVILERFLVKIFPNNRFDKILPQLHSKSPRKTTA
uniref:Sorting nexin-13 n=1 Tax=Strongyloides papillosus TaxID=174720 RepID=A0A0N5B8J8_STREA